MTTIAESFLPEFDAEMKKTRRLLERVPEGRFDWKPHEKSRTLGALATHVAEVPRFGLRFDADVWQAGSDKAPELKTAAALVDRFDENVAASRASIARKTDAQMEGDFTVLRPDGQPFFKLSRRALVRNILLNHLIHHRGQLSVYLRENDVPVPSIYGPSADEAI
ncbi:MAG TPA: DinB family protein [Thermoanaerobaculia bacterium]